MNIARHVIDLIGNTPVMELTHPFIPKGKKLLLKLESFNPTGSIKDRTALGLIQHAFSTGKLHPGGVVIESTSGNLGKSLAMLGAAMNFKVILVVDPKVSPLLKNWCEVYGAKMVTVTEVDENGGYQKTRIQKVKELLAENDGAYWPNQYDNEANPNIHYAETAKELLNLDIQTIFGAISTGGHMTGIAKYVKDNKKGTKIVACDVMGSAVFGGTFKPYRLNGIGLAWKSNNVDITLFDNVCHVSDQEAISMCHLVAKEVGILLGGSSGLVVFAAMSYLLQGYSDKALCMVADDGVLYLHQIYDRSWLDKHQISLLDEEKLKISLANLSFKTLSSFS